MHRTHYDHYTLVVKLTNALLIVDDPLDAVVYCAYMQSTDDLAVMAEKIKPILEKHGVEYAGVFGSYARGQARPDSDIDILVRFNLQRRPHGLIAYVRMVHNLEDILNKNVDLVEDEALNRHIRPQIAHELRTIYGQR